MKNVSDFVKPVEPGVDPRQENLIPLIAGNLVINCKINKPERHVGQKSINVGNLASEQALHLGESREVTQEQHAKGDASARGGKILRFSLAVSPLVRALSCSSLGS